MAYIEFNEFNKFCQVYQIDCHEKLLDFDLEAIFDAKINTCYTHYNVTKNDYFMDCQTMLNNERAALSRCEDILNEDTKRRQTGKAI